MAGIPVWSPSASERSALKEEALTSAGRAENPSTRFVLPHGTCDAHCHVFGPADRFPYAPGRRYTPADTPKEALAALHRGLGIDRAVIVQASAHGIDNRAMVDALRASPRTLRGVAIVDDSFDERALLDLHEAGVRGVRFNFVRALGGHPDMAVVGRVIDRIRPFGWHVVLHLQGDDVSDLAATIRALPVPFVIDHMGRVPAKDGVDQKPFRDLLDLMRLDGAWVKVSGAERMARFPFGEALPFAKALVAARPDRVLWGTDYPHPNLPDPVDENDIVALIPDYAADIAAQHRLLVANPVALYGFDEP